MGARWRLEGARIFFEYWRGAPYRFFSSPATFARAMFDYDCPPVPEPSLKTTKG